MSVLIVTILGMVPWILTLALGSLTGNHAWFRRSEGALVLGFVLWFIGNLLISTYLGAALDVLLVAYFCRRWFKHRAERVAEQLAEVAQIHLASPSLGHAA
jgi:Flp pilus assembly protein TadB